MSNIIGLDPEAVEQLSRDLKGEAHKIGEVISRIDGLVSHMENVWKGQDAQQFAGWWRDQHRKALHNAQSAVEGLGQSAWNNAQEQRGVSNR